MLFESLAIFAHRESPDTLCETIESAVTGRNRLSRLDVLINGNPALAAAVTARLPSLDLAALQGAVHLWSIRAGDKANAWNQYVHSIWDGAELAFFIDGYVQLQAESITRLAGAMRRSPSALAGTGVPSVGRSAKSLRQSLLRDGGLHGNFHCVRGSTIRTLRERGIDLPVGIYRIDGILGALLCFGLDPVNLRWDRSRITVGAEATWRAQEKQWWRYSDLQSQYHRLIRQAQGDLENLAIKDCLVERRLALEALPKSVTELVEDWVRRRPVEAARALRLQPLRRRALRTLGRNTDWTPTDTTAHRIASRYSPHAPRIIATPWAPRPQAVSV